MCYRLHCRDLLPGLNFSHKKTFKTDWFLPHRLLVTTIEMKTIHLYRWQGKKPKPLCKDQHTPPRLWTWQVRFKPGSVVYSLSDNGKVSESHTLQSGSHPPLVPLRGLHGIAWTQKALSIAPAQHGVLCKWSNCGWQGWWQNHFAPQGKNWFMCILNYILMPQCFKYNTNRSI